MAKRSQRIVFYTVLLPILFFYNSLPANDCNSRIDSLKDLVTLSIINDSIRVEALSKLCSELRSKDPIAALDYGMEAIQIAENLNLKIQQAHALSGVGVVYWQLGDFEHAMDYFFQARIIHKDNDDEIGYASTLTNIGLIFSDKSHYDKALEYYFEALRIFEEENYKQGIAPVLNNIGLIYQNRRNFELSEKYHYRSLAIKQDIYDIKGTAFSYNNLGIVNMNMKKYETALEYFNKALEIRRNIGDKREMASTICQIGNLFIENNDYDIAIDSLKNALELYNTVNDKSGISQTYFFLGIAYLYKNQLLDAEEFFYKSLKKAKDIGLTRMIISNYFNLAKVCAAKNDFKKAYDYQNLHINIKDSLYSEENQRKIFEFQTIFEAERKEKEIELYRKASHINALNFEKERILKNFLIVAIVLVLVLLFLIYNRFLVITKTNKLLKKRQEEISQRNQELKNLNNILFEQKKKVEELNQKLNQTNKKLVESEQQLIKANYTKDKFFSIISHDLRNPFASIVSFSRMLKRDLDNLEREELQQLTNELDKSVVKINNLLENMLYWSRTQSGKIKYDPQYLDMSVVINENIDLFKPSIKEKEIDVKINFPDNLIVWADQNMTDTVVRNLLSNAIKFSNTSGKIQISSSSDEIFTYISIKDWGVGISNDNQNKLFRSDSLHSTYGTMEEKGSGLGLLLCKEFVEIQHGNITFESKEGRGSVFTFSLPLNDNL